VVDPPGACHLRWQQAGDIGEAALRDRVGQLLAAPFDLAREWPLRVHVLECAPGDHVLVLVLHHIAGDGWSLGVLARELSVAYAAALGGRGPELPPLPLQYADYALRQAEWQKSDEWARQLRFWTERLRDAPPLLELAPDTPRPAQPS